MNMVLKASALALVAVLAAGCSSNNTEEKLAAVENTANQAQQTAQQAQQTADEANERASRMVKKAGHK